MEETLFQKTEAYPLAESMVRSLYKHLGQHIKLIYVADTTVLTDYYIVCQGRSGTHMQSLASHLDDDMALLGQPAVRIEGKNGSEWILADFGSVIVHIFSREAMDFYKFERLFDEKRIYEFSDEELKDSKITGETPDEKD